MLAVPLEGEFDIHILGKAVRLTRPGCAWALKSMYTYGYRRSPWERAVRRVIQEMLAQRPQVFFDIGSNVGIYAYIASVVSPTTRVYAFEPLPTNVEYIRKTAAVNGFTNILIAPLALSDTNGTAAFYVPVLPGVPDDYHADTASLINRFRGSDRRHNATQARQITVDVMMLDEYVRREGISRIDIVKLDVEEAELNVLRGAEKTLTAMSPDVTCELLLDNPQCGEVFDQMKRLGYSAYLITEFGLIPEPTAPIFVRAREEKKKLAIWNDHLFTQKGASEVAMLARRAFGIDAPDKFLRKVRDKTKYVISE
jgi:FkbM family methyltransferase